MIKNYKICVVGAGPWGLNHIRTLQKIGSLAGVVELDNSILDGVKKEFPNFYDHFKLFKSKLLKRYDYKNGINYWDWSFLRSYKIQKTNQKKICIPCKLRIKNYEDINFSLVDENYLLTQDVTSIFINKEIKEDIRYILGFLNSSVVKKWIFINNNNRGNVLEFSE